MFRLDGKVALVTGAGQNIGAGVALQLARQGATVLVNDYFAERAEETAARIREAGGTASALPFDVTDRDAVRAAVQQARADVGPVDILVNNAGNGGAGEPMPTKPFVETSPDAWQRIIAVNLEGLFHCVQAVLPSMVERRWGRIITHTSGAGQRGLDIGVSTYGAAKAGQIGFMRHLTIETAAHGVTCNTIAVGLVVADPVPQIMHLAESIPAKRLGTPEDVANLAVYLASEEASWVTGQTIGVNGGSLIP